MAFLLQDASSSLASGESISRAISQTSHGFTVGQWVYRNGSTYTLTNNTSAASCEAPLLVSSVTTDTFNAVSSGYFAGLTGLTPGETYFLGSTSGSLTGTTPTTGFIRPVFRAETATAGYVTQSPTVQAVTGTSLVTKFYTATQSFTSGVSTTITHGLSLTAGTFELILIEVRTSAGVRVDDTATLFTTNSVNLTVPATLTNARVKILRI